MDRQSVYLGNNRALTRTIHGHKMYVDTRDVSLAPHILLDGNWESWVSDLFLQMVKPGMTVLDVGANIGWFSLLAAQNVGPQGRVIAFEPDPNTHGLVTDTLEINGFRDRAIVLKAAVSDEPGEATFYRWSQHHGSNGLVINDDIRREFPEQVEEIKVEVITIDDVIAEAGGNVDVIKIDAEGAEPNVLRGAQRVLAANPNVRILLEYRPPCAPVLRAMRDDGFAIALLTHQGDLVPVLDEQLDDASAQLDMVLVGRPTVSAPVAQVS
jgi:FkbM family methyltransferase